MVPWRRGNSTAALTVVKSVRRNFQPKTKMFGTPLLTKTPFENRQLLTHLLHTSVALRREILPAKPLPRLLYVQNPLIWFTNKMDFRFLRKKWDPSFSEDEFVRGARQAVALVTQLITKNNFTQMKPLMTKNALLNLRRDVEILWADEVRRNISLSPDNVQLTIPRKVHFRHLHQGPPPNTLCKPEENNMKRFCDIDVVFIGLKWLDTYRLQNPPLLFVDIIARFHRNYTDGILPDWTIAAFRVRRFNVLPGKQKRENTQ